MMKSEERATKADVELARKEEEMMETMNWVLREVLVREQASRRPERWRESWAVIITTAKVKATHRGRTHNVVPAAARA
ncbi:hypothetical protein I312_104090 [Cryptococcus bacillisporus CA1280]|uniref:uncharacterized protein n=1 Tax=Cryptococcus bacillisporus CA1280 TaxID=1296109 RepID=UPI0033688251